MAHADSKPASKPIGALRSVEVARLSSTDTFGNTYTLGVRFDNYLARVRLAEMDSATNIAKLLRGMADDIEAKAIK
jgi:hypothetical protein